MDVIDRPVLQGASEGPGVSAFGGFVRTGQTVELKAFTGVTGDAGGYAVPREIDAAIDRALTSISPIRRIAQVVKVGSAGYRKLATTGGTPSGWAAETEARPGTATPVFAEVSPPSGELYANPSASQAMLDDAAFDVESWLADEIATEFARAEGQAFVTGSGVNRPKGFLTGPVAAGADGSRPFGTLQYLPSGAAGDFAGRGGGAGRGRRAVSAAWTRPRHRAGLCRAGGLGTARGRVWRRGAHRISAARRRPGGGGGAARRHAAAGGCDTAGRRAGDADGAGAAASGGVDGQRAGSCRCRPAARGAAAGAGAVDRDRGMAIGDGLMATLLLTTVGGALGGPVGAALGAIAGNAVDRSVLGRRPREGPRLTELRVQTSSYGAAIPRLFGTLRVAGTVIWSTDLRETRSVERAGKGQPGVARYSYTASFAVLLSARAVAGVGRVWADGQLIRGGDGGWKVRTGFRLHRGEADQPVDPLIAAAEGPRTPAHRGHAYVVFEDMALESFGNRLPSLSFEVIAEVGPVGVGAIARELAPEATGEAVLSVDGFAAIGGSVAAVLETLAQASGAWFAPVRGGLNLRDGGAAVAELAEQRDRARSREVAAADSVPAAVTVSHYDPQRDWQVGLQRARRTGAGATLHLEVPAAMSAAAAKGMAEAALARADAGRVRRTVPATLAGLRLDPGDVVTLAGETGSWRVDAVALEAMATTVTLSPLARAPQPVDASAGRVLAQADLAIGGTLLVAAELPALDDALLPQPRLLVVAAGEGPGWRAAPLLLSLDDGASWTQAGVTAAPGVIGTVTVPAGASTAALIDTAGSVEVVLARADMMLADADARALDAGANLALIGEELMQFARAEPLGGGRWRLTGLWRGRRGTAATAGLGGDRFALLTADTVRAIDLPLTKMGAAVRVMAAGIGDGDDPAATVAPVTGASVLPPAPVALRWAATADGAALVSWTRRSRIGWRWLDRVDAPLGEESEAFRVTIAGPDGTREVVVTAPAVMLTSAERAGATVAVRQRGTWGDSAPASLEVEG